MSSNYKITQNEYEINSIRLFVEEMGEGEPLLMIPGLGAGSWLWRKSISLSENFRLIMPHLRGSGRSDKPDHRYTIEQFSDDINCLMEKLSLDRFHVVGVSMGGFVAQSFACAHPEKVQSLSLVCTSAGGTNQVGPDGYTLSRMIRLRGKTRDERMMDAYKLNFTEGFLESHPDEIEAITQWRIRYPQPEFAYYRQLLAGTAFSGVDLQKINGTPTLILGGKEDEMVPAEDVQKLNELIHGSTKIMMNGKHMFFMENADEFNHELTEFFMRNAMMETENVYR